MRAAPVQAPVSLLLDEELTPSAKLLWLALQASSPTVASRSRLPVSRAGTSRSLPIASPETLVTRCGLSLPTIRKSLAQLDRYGWHPPGKLGSAETVLIPAALLSDRRVRPRARLLYGILQTLTGFREKTGEFTYASLRSSTGLSVVTLRQLARELEQTGWMQLRQANQKAPLRFSLRNPELERSSAEAAEAEERLEEADFRGEAIMKEYLSLIIDSDEFEDNARPGFLINPLTEERLELDRYYPPFAAFEFNGSQHYRTSPRYPSHQALAMQQTRDLLKEALCARRGVRVVVITPQDLNLASMQQKVGSLLPLRSLEGHEELIRFLEKAGRSYQD